MFLATSPAHRDAKLGLSCSGVLNAIERAVAHATGHFDIIAFGAEDASRTEPEFLAKCLEVAIDAGATSVGIPDTLGVLIPRTAAEMVCRIQDDVPNIEHSLIAVYYHDDLGLATTNSLAAIEAGAHIVQCTVGGIGERAGNAALEEVALIIARAAIRLMLAKRYGRIVNVGSVGGLTGAAGQTNYAASKGALPAFTRSLAFEVARFNIRVNCVLPGIIETDMSAAMPLERRRSMIELTAMKRLGQPEEVAEVIHFLLSDAAS